MASLDSYCFPAPPLRLYFIPSLSHERSILPYEFTGIMFLTARTLALRLWPPTVYFIFRRTSPPWIWPQCPRSSSLSHLSIVYVGVPNTRFHPDCFPAFKARKAYYSDLCLFLCTRPPLPKDEPLSSWTKERNKIKKNPTCTPNGWWTGATDRCPTPLFVIVL